MLSTISTVVTLAPLVLLSIMPHQTDAHTWIDCFDTDRSKIYDQSASYIFGGAGGNGFCQGYGAGYPGRGNVDIGTEYTYKMLKNEVEAGTPVCENVGTDSYTNTDWRKRLSVPAGQTAYFAYLPNGHIVKDKKGVGTQHGVYWTGQVGTSLTSTLDIKPENLIDGHTMDYDDGTCGESVDYYGNPAGRAGDGKPCIGSFTIPAGTAPGTYSMVWFWTFWLDNESAYVDQTQAKGYFGAAYSTCFEVEVTSGGLATAPTTKSTTAPGVVQATAPTITTPAPVVTTSAPVATTGAPATPAVAAQVTPTPTPAPVVTTAAPVATTGAPATPAVAAQVTPAPAPAPVVTASTAAPTAAPATHVPVAAPAVTSTIPAATPEPPVAKPSLTTVPAAAPAATTDTPQSVGTVEPALMNDSESSDKDFMETVRPANNSSASASSSSAAEVGSAADVEAGTGSNDQAEQTPSVIAPPPSTGSASAMTQDSSANPIELSLPWLISGLALLAGALL